MEGKPTNMDDKSGKDTNLPASYVDKDNVSEETGLENEKDIGLPASNVQTDDVSEQLVLENEKDVPMQKKRGRKSGPGQRQSDSSYGTQFPCDFCPYSYWNKTSLIAHLKQNHNDKDDTKRNRLSDSSKEKTVSVSRVSRQSMNTVVDKPISTRKTNVPLADPVKSAPLVQQKPFRASTQSVFKGLSPFNVQNVNIGSSRSVIQTEYKPNVSNVIEYKPAALRRVAEKSFSPSPGPSGFTSINRQVARTSLLSNSVPNDGIEKSVIPLSAGIFTKSAKEPNELMIVWTEELEKDTLVAVNLNRENSILCIKELDIGSITEKKRELINKGHWFNFSVLDNDHFCTTWTVISFGETNPSFFKNKLFYKISEVEEKFSQYAQASDKKIVNIMRYEKEGLYPLLTRSLVEKIMAFN